MGDVEIRLLGTLSIKSVKGGELALARKNKALLAALALAGPAGLPREKLVGLFWSGRAEKQAQASLRQALTTVRKALGPFRDSLQADAATAAIDTAMVTVDACEFEALCESNDQREREQALNLYQGDLLDGARIKEEGFEAWLRPTRERLRSKAVRLLCETLDATSEGGEIYRPGLAAAGTGSHQ